MAERTGLVTLGGNPVTLVGQEINVGDAAPDFVAVNNEMGPAKLSDYKGKVVVIAAVPSLDTAVCDIEVRRFNNEVTNLSEDIVVLAVSMDLPFAQKRWCGAHGVERVMSVSDHKDADFGEKYGVLIKEARLLARSVFVVDREGIVKYVEIVKEVGSEPKYEDALQVAHDLSK